VVSLHDRLATMEARVRVLEAENLELRAQLAKNSQNSSKPPSSDLPGTRPPKAKRGKRRKRGGQPGHVGRFAADPERIDQVKQYRAKICKHCQADLTKGEPTGSVISHIVYELPEIRPIATDHQCLDMRCTECGMVTPAQLPPEVPAGQYGPSVQAMTGLIRGELRQSVRQTSEVMTRVLHVPMSTGMVSKTQEQVSRVLAAPHAEAIGHLQRSDRAHADETGWRVDKAKAWLWVGVTALVIAFIVHRRRSKQAAKELLGAGFRGILVCDRWASYNWIDAACRQMCWSHLKRDFKSFLDYGPEAKWLGEQLLAERKKLFRLWNRVRDGTMTRTEFQLACRPIRRRIEARLEEGAGLSSAKVSGMCREILKQRAALFTFIDFEGVEPTNNAAERAIRFAVLMRKGCFGSDSARGARFIERFLTVRGTLRLQKRDLYEYLKAACTAALHGLPAPSLLPKSAVQPDQALAVA
jgi:transposase